MRKLDNFIEICDADFALADAISKKIRNLGLDKAKLTLRAVSHINEYGAKSPMLCLDIDMSSDSVSIPTKTFFLRSLKAISYHDFRKYFTSKRNGIRVVTYLPDYPEIAKLAEPEIVSWAEKAAQSSMPK
jgi:hypothetical protein